MNIKLALIRKAIKLAPLGLVVWGANKVLKGIAKLNHLGFDLDTRKASVNTLLAGESEPIQVLIDGFSILRDGENYSLVVHRAESNKLWLNNIFAKVTGKAWKIPVPPQYAHHFELVAELFKGEETKTV